MNAPTTNIKALVVANPVSGHGKAKRYLPAVADMLEGAGWSVEALRTERAGDARRAAAGFDGGLIVSFGGDGTFNEILNGADLERSVLAVLPAGTGNVLAKELRMPLNPLRAARAIINGKVLRYDVGNACGRRFAFACGAGLDAHIVRLLHSGRTGNITQLHYLPHLLKNALSPPQWRIGVEIDGAVHDENANVVCIGNTKSYGGPVELTPRADPGDRLFEVTTARVESPLDLPVLALAALSGGMAACNYARCAPGCRIKLSSSRKDTPYHIDGDFAGTLPLTVTMETEQMRIIGAQRPDAREPLLPL